MYEASLLILISKENDSKHALLKFALRKYIVNSELLDLSLVFQPYVNRLLIFTFQGIPLFL